MSHTPSTWPARVTAWYRRNGRALPWRETDSPYHIWVSEIMAQQTRIDTVIPYYERFLKRFPSVDSLARADLQSVLKLWEGLGYYSRARNLHRAAGVVMSDYHGELPRDYETLQTLPGLGPYTAAAVASFAFGEKVPVVDGNVLRVFTRFFGIDTDIRKPSTRNAIFDHLSPAIRTVDPGDFNQGIMELGALVCTPKSPDCAACPLRKDCTALRDDRVDELPVKSPAAKVPHHEVAVGVIWRRGRVLIARGRPASGCVPCRPQPSLRRFHRVAHRGGGRSVPAPPHGDDRRCRWRRRPDRTAGQDRARLRGGQPIVAGSL